METDWKNKYEEAIKKVELLRGYSVEGNAKIDELFPELAESEDERIRKGLIKLLSEGSDAYLVKATGIGKDAYLAWLEKQKEQKLFPKFKVGDTIRCKYDDREFTIKSVDLEAGVYKYTKEGCGNDIDYADEDFELVEQKPAEKQDYSGLNDLERAIHRGFLSAGVENVPVGIIKDTASECIGFLALIDDKPAEFSGDERIRSALLRGFHSMLANQPIGTFYGEQIKDIIAYLEKQKEAQFPPSRNTILNVWELGNLWKEYPDEREGLTQLQFIQKFWFDKGDYADEQNKCP